MSETDARYTWNGGIDFLNMIVATCKTKVDETPKEGLPTYLEGLSE